MDIGGAALRMHDMGLSVIAADADDGKSVRGVVSGFQNWRRRLPRDKVGDLFARHPGACIALLVGHSGLVVADCDSDDALGFAAERFGPSPILVRTPGGRGGHLYYREHGEPVRPANLRRSHGVAIDIKAGRGAYVIVPPSVRPSTGRPYRFERGTWSDLPSLPAFHPLERNAPAAPSTHDGARNQHLFRKAMALASRCETSGDLEFRLAAVNEVECQPPLGFEEVNRIAASAWSYQAQGKNLIGRGRHVVVPEASIRSLITNPDALALDMLMRLEHEGLRPAFAASAKGMAAAAVVPGWSPKRYRNAVTFLVETGQWRRVKVGGRGAGDPSQYVFADRSAGSPKGEVSSPNTNKTPLPPVPSDLTAIGPSQTKEAA